MIFFVFIIKIFNDVSVFIHHHLFIVHHLLAILMLILMATCSGHLMLIHQILLELPPLVLIHVIHVDHLVVVFLIAVAVIFIIIFHVDFELLLLLHHLSLLLLLHASHELLLELLLQLLLHVHADLVGMSAIILLMLVVVLLLVLLFVLVIFVLLGLASSLSILLVNLCDMRATRVVVSLHVVVDWLVMTLSLSFFFFVLLVIFIITHVFLLLILLNGFSPDHVVVVHDHHVVIPLVLTLLFLFFLVVLVIIHVLLLLHLLVLVLLKKQLLLLVLLKRGLRREVPWEVGGCYVQAIVVLSTQEQLFLVIVKVIVRVSASFSQYVHISLKLTDLSKVSHESLGHLLNQEWLIGDIKQDRVLLLSIASLKLSILLASLH